MEIIINEDPLLAGKEYKIYIKDKLSFIACSSLINLTPITNMIEPPNDIKVLTLKKRISLFKCRYSIIYPDNDTYFFNAETIWNNYFTCTYSSDNYEVYLHKQRRYSVYKNTI